MTNDDWRSRVHERWRDLVDAFVASGGDAPTFQEDGSWTANSGLCVDAAHLLRGSRVAFASHWDGSTPLEDSAGEIGEEMSYRVETAEEHLAVLSMSSHWQAGDTVSLFVATSLERYRRVRDERVAEARAEIEHQVWFDERSLDDPTIEERAEQYTDVDVPPTKE